MLGDVRDLTGWMLGTQVVNRVLESLDQWRLRVAWLDLQLLCQQLTTSSGGVAAGEMNLLLDTVARAVLDVFELTTNQSVIYFSRYIFDKLFFLFT